MRFWWLGEDVDMLRVPLLLFDRRDSAVEAAITDAQWRAVQDVDRGAET